MKIKYDKNRLLHEEGCHCNFCLDAISECYGLKVGQEIDYENRKCKIVRLLPPSFKPNTCTVLVHEIKQDSNFMDWTTEEKINDALNANSVQNNSQQNKIRQHPRDEPSDSSATPSGCGTKSADNFNTKGVQDE